MEHSITKLSYFSEAKIGDKVYCTKKGKGKITSITRINKLIIVGFDTGGYWIYNQNGSNSYNPVQSLFYLDEE